MKAKIIDYLQALEKERDIEILLACETGSRAWGFPSTDSDYDVRVLYRHPKKWYLSLNEPKDSIELMLDNNEIDISGWDLRKALRLLSKSNAPLLERIQSPIIYKAKESFINDFKTISKSQYSRIATIHHYLNLAKKKVEEIDTEQYKLKSFFYALRASVACLWILEREEMPPIEFPVMLEKLNIPADLTKRINELILFKATITESDLHSGENELIQFMHTLLERADLESKSLPKAKGKLEDLNTFFRNSL